MPKLEMRGRLDVDELWPDGKLVAGATTEVETPSDVFDVFGRMVADATVDTTGPGTVKVNTLLLETGAALPAIYARAGT